MYFLDTMFIQRLLTDFLINKNQKWENVPFVLSHYCILTCKLVFSNGLILNVYFLAFDSRG